ncbi:MAG: HPr-rel-A system PqqD family peptide chaperone [Actinomycetota bacterium]
MSSSARRLPMLEESLRVPADYTPRKRADVLELDMGDGVILYDNESSLVHHLNPSAALMWHMCDGSGSISDLARDISEEYGLERRTIHGQVTTVIAEFDALGLVEDAREQLEARDGR